MDINNRTRLTFGVALILLGGIFLAVRFIPGLESQFSALMSWPMIIIAVGVGLLFLGLLAGTPGMAVPACIVAGIGGILYWQNTTGRYETWSFAWALIPGFVGVGILLASLLGDRQHRSAWEGFNMIITSAVLFLIFGSIFGGFESLGTYWPLLIVGAGVLLLVRAFIKK
jgi:hypothetical protein